LARRGALGGFSLDLFGGGGVDAGVFNIASQSKQNEAYLALTRVEVQWEAGKVSNADYLAALGTYAQTFPADSAERLNQESRLESTTYRIERNVLVAQVNTGTKTMTDLLAYDKSKLAGLNPDSQEYLDRQGRVQDSQGQLFNEEEEKVIESYSDGKMTTAQLSNWYKARQSDARFGDNPDLQKEVTKRIGDLADRVVEERDQKMIADYADGKVTPQKFLTYAATARARYKDGTTQAQDWDGRIEGAKDAAVEGDLSYRYSLSQEYLRLKQFIAGAQAPKGTPAHVGKPGTQHSKRTVLGSDGHWHTVTVTTHTPGKSYPGSGPSPAEQKAWAKLQIEVAEAKRQMAAITTKIGKLQGGWVTTDDMLGYYKRQLVRVKKGTPEWYQIQQRIDGLNDSKANERVLAKQGVKTTFSYVSSNRGRETYQVPGTKATSSSSTKKPKATSSGSIGNATTQSSSKSHPNTSLDQFMSGLAKIESGGRYDARNSQTGAFGKYQILPGNWSSWASKAGLPPDAKPTPENQEKVVRNRMQHLYNKYDGDYSKMAAEWFAGAGGSHGGDSSQWGPNTRRYVQKVMAAAGSSYSPSRTAGSTAPAYPGGTGGGGASSSTAAHSTGSGVSHPSAGGKADPKKPSLKIVTGVTYYRNDTRRATGGAHEDSSGDSKAGREKVTTKNLNLPTNLDARQFRKIYDAIEYGFNHGQEGVVIDLGGGHRMQVFIGDDPDEQIATMRMLDDLRIDLADVEVKSYDGTGSGAAVSQRAIAARKDAASHELLILSSSSPYDHGAKSNPLTAANRILDQTVSGIAQEVTLMNSAYARGDLTNAYLHAQKIQTLSSGLELDGKHVGDLSHLADLVAEADARVGKIVGATGVKVPSVVQADLDRLHNAMDEINKAAAPGEKTATDLSNVLQKDSSGQVVWSTTGPNGTVKLRPDMIQVVTGSGKVEVKPNTKTEVRKDGSVGPVTPDNMVPVMVKAGNSVISAYANYTVGKVGFAMLPDGTKVPLTGKIVSVPTDKNQDGVPDGTSTYFENPLTPGKWSNTAILYNAPKGTKVVYGKGTDDPAFQFTDKDGASITLQTDPKTGVYTGWYQGKGTGFGPEPEPVPLGASNQNKDLADALKDWTRDTSNGAPLDLRTDTGMPALGFEADDLNDVQLNSTLAAYKKFVDDDVAKKLLGGVGASDHAPTLTKERLALRATSQQTDSQKRGTMAQNSDLAREMLDESNRVSPKVNKATGFTENYTRGGATSGVNNATGFTLKKLPSQKLATVDPARSPNRNLLAIDQRMGGERVTATSSKPAHSAQGSTTKKKAGGPAPSRPAPKAKAVVKRKITPLPKPKPRTTTTVRSTRNTAL